MTKIIYVCHKCGKRSVIIRNWGKIEKDISIQKECQECKIETPIIKRR